MTFFNFFVRTLLAYEALFVMTNCVCRNFLGNFESSALYFAHFSILLRHVKKTEKEA